MYLYIYDQYQGGPEGRKRTEALVRRCAEWYIREERVNIGTVSPIILRTERGKPYFKEVPVEFSVSHTGRLWVCLIDRDPVGVDIQYMRKCRREPIAGRYFTPDEQEYATAMGEAGFFQIWTRKEAYVKFTGEGINEKMKDVSTLRSNEVEFVDFDIQKGVKGSCCMKEKRELWIRRLT